VKGYYICLTLSWLNKEVIYIFEWQLLSINYWILKCDYMSSERFKLGIASHSSHISFRCVLLAEGGFLWMNQGIRMIVNTKILIHFVLQWQTSVPVQYRSSSIRTGFLELGVVRYWTGGGTGPYRSKAVRSASLIWVIVNLNTNEQLDTYILKE